MDKEVNENCEANQHEWEYVDDSFSDGFYSYSGSHYRCCNCGKDKTEED